MDAARIRRESMRWYIILALNNARPSELVEHIVQSTMRELFPDTTPMEVRRALDYLASRDLINVRKVATGIWWASLTRHGVDLAEYSIDCEPGIARPEKYWGGYHGET